MTSEEIHPARIAANLAAIRTAIDAACRRGGRVSNDVELIAVSKTFPAAALRAAFDAGQLVFGESKLQEAEPKIAELPEQTDWHFIGRVQRNKLRKILQLFGTVHAIDSLRLALAADGIAADLGLEPKIFLQVNIGGEETKGGFSPDELRPAMEQLAALKRVQICGLMCIPQEGEDAESARRWFVALRDLRDAVARDSGMKLPGLSMGMSGDYQVAIEEGATHIRVGSAIFGNRAYRVDGELGSGQPLR